ncbi:hypothetical protein LTR37_015041 [Vermiconidia calcicola]|uniref:Uncharacterized protein n=1 Tax=Vermiconidia calcicola TaxID=1690605 RepID=A0ACC3MRU9_9PEZI|nr:hypothetical protein LTR37_015041 [Vermiconidia calcicola]
MLFQIWILVTLAATIALVHGRKLIICGIVQDASTELSEIREQLAIYEDVDESYYLHQPDRRSTSGDLACDQAMHKAEQYAPVYLKALQKYEPAIEAAVELAEGYCKDVGRSTQEDEDAAWPTFSQYVDAGMRYSGAERERERLNTAYEGICEASAEEDLVEAGHYEL